MKLKINPLIVGIATIIMVSCSEKEQLGIATVRDSLNVRQMPSVKSKKAGSIPALAIVNITETGKEERIGKKTASWYKIKYHKVQGWVFGGFIHKLTSSNRHSIDKLPMGGNKIVEFGAKPLRRGYAPPEYVYFQDKKFEIGEEIHQSMDEKEMNDLAMETCQISSVYSLDSWNKNDDLAYEVQCTKNGKIGSMVLRKHKGKENFTAAIKSHQGENIYLLDFGSDLPRKAGRTFMDDFDGEQCLNSDQTRTIIISKHGSEVSIEKEGKTVRCDAKIISENGKARVTSDCAADFLCTEMPKSYSVNCTYEGITEDYGCGP